MTTEPLANAKKRRSIVFIILAALVGSSPSALLSADGTNGAVAVPVQSLRVVVDPRAELLSVIFRLAGNPEYNIPCVKSYDEDVEKHFGKFREHPAVKLAQKVRETRKVSYNAPMSLAIHLTDTGNLQLRVPLEPWPEGLDRRWTISDAKEFTEAARQFVEDTSFRSFIEQHGPFYQTVATRMQAVLDKEAHLEWFDTFFGQRSNVRFTVVIGLLNGNGNYGVQFRATGSDGEMFCILRPWGTDSQGLPEFRNTVPTVVHEFCHSYCNAIIERHLAELQSSGEALFEPVSKQMRSRAYSNAQTLLKESLVRACVIRYRRQYEGEEAARRVAQSEKKNGFLCMPELVDLLADYEAHREQYPTLEDFSTRLIGFFADAADKISRAQADLTNDGSPSSQ